MKLGYSLPPLLSLLLLPLASQNRLVEGSLFGFRNQHHPNSLTTRESSFCGAHHMPCPAAEPCCNSKAFTVKCGRVDDAMTRRQDGLTNKYPSPYRWNLPHNIHGGMPYRSGMRLEAFALEWMLHLASMSPSEGDIQEQSPCDSKAGLYRRSFASRLDFQLSSYCTLCQG